ncbi:SWIM zinc finger family protein [Halosimplex amylolyticum]|uniref:SWIM zinc finger family protein n=1 Tax=Halosimplex amylolyticum TaxID=3396616 RepID=UPI003F56B8E1
MPAERVDGGALDEASRRAWTEAMTVRPFGDGYLVDCEGGTHYVSLAPSDCSCPGSADDARCEHVRRVAIEINLGRVPPPAERTIPCRGCDRRVAVSAADSPPALCAECHLEPGDVVVDAEADEETPLLVVSEPGRPADVVALPDDDRTVASYPGNDGYPADEPVVEAVYPQAVSTRRDPQRYLFPLARLRRPERDRGTPPERGDESGDGESGRDDG